ncbi:uncharacterized protein FA14DRAFT_182572 [Meira miltonrushii]|uniref:Uncharacterized protein n=1 Tax=Meira miltonrushii TaxID=1280837 RepID=A0A316V2N4_9BASI|nr:uncharacterized protein FA14DRAFT_182572 [Meira miltonrushii]PWN31780.1 hypothetical protein FA14DRAFT_182572 [Meira miltonrushii]
MVTLVTVSYASPAAVLSKRSGKYQSIVDDFAKIDQTIKELDEAQSSSPQTGKPDFSKSAKGLAQLSMEAESAEFKLRALGTDKLDASSAASIGGSLTSSSQHVKGITDMVKAGKQWFEQYHATSTVVTILKTNIAQFKDLFSELNRHVDYATVKSYAAPEVIFICSMVDAVAYLDPNAVSASAKAFCASHKTDTFDPNVFAGDANSPSGFGSCHNSPTTFYQQAYTSGTMGTGSTSCTSGTQTPNSFSIPNNVLMLSQ